MNNELEVKVIEPGVSGAELSSDSTPKKKKRAPAKVKETVEGAFSKKIKENAEQRLVSIKPSDADTGKFKSADRILAFRVAFALSIPDASAKSKKFQDGAAEALKIRDRLKKAGMIVGQGYTTKELAEGISKENGNPGLATFIGFSEKSTRFPIFSGKDGRKILTVKGFNNPKDDRQE